MNAKTCLITGGTGGIGRQVGLELAKQGATVVLLGRNRERGEAAQTFIRQQSSSAKVELMLCDLASQQSIRQFAADFQQRYGALHVLVNNAGVIKKRRELTVDGIETTFAVNHLAYFLLTNLLLDTLAVGGSLDDPARIINVSSNAHKVLRRLDFENLQGEKRYKPFRAYCVTKLANILFTHALLRRLKGKFITANALHPGVINTDISRENSALFVRLAYRLWGRSVEEGAQTPVYLATSPEVIPLTGMYFDTCRATPSSRASYDREAEEKLWQHSAQLTLQGDSYEPAM